MKFNNGLMQHAFRIFLLLAFGCALNATSVAQNQYYVNSSTGSDSNDGSQARPWATINHANAALTAGNPGACVAASGWSSASGIGACVHVASGTYSGGITTSKSGASTARIRYVSDNQYGARLVGNSSSGTIWEVAGGFTDVVGFDFDGSVNASEVQGLVIDKSAPHTSVINNRFHDIAKNGGSTQTAVLSATSAGSNSSGFNLYDGNLIYHNNGGAGHASSSGAAHTGLTTGINDTAQNNVIMDQGGGWCIQATHSSSQLIVTNNTMLNCDRGGLIIDNENGSTNDFSTFTNNIVANSGAFGGSAGIRIFSGGCGSHNLYANNLVYGNSPSNYQFDNGCPNTSTGTQSGSDSSTFVNYTGTVSGDYHLKSGAAAIQNGTTSCASGVTSCAPVMDIEAIVRATPLDIGSFAVGGSSSATAPTAPTGLTASVN